ncbi:MAG TPA: HAD family hydrolase [Firmicutes bacterium]|nr:HAD family hydrolase [Bacillota bacterium]
MEGKKGAVFLDRDGTIIEEVNYLRDPADIRLLPGAAEGLTRLQEHYPLVIVTNQAGVARGYFDELHLSRLHRHLEHILAREGIHLAGIYYCPHHPEEGRFPYRRDCPCRKPKPGMLLTAARDLLLDLSQSYTIGDKLSDIGAGRNAGTKAILVRTGWGQEEERLIGGSQLIPDYVADNLLDAAAWILRQRPNTGK